MWLWLSTDCLARAGFSRRSIAAIPSAPPPPPPGRACTGLARERESVGGARRCLPRGAGAASGGAGGWGDARGAQEAGNDPRVPLPPPRDSPAGPEKRHEKHLSNLLRHPQPSPADLSLLLNGSPVVEHTSPVVNSPRSFPRVPGTSLLMGRLVLPGPGIVYSWQDWLWGCWRREVGTLRARKGTGSGLILCCTGASAVLLFRGGVWKNRPTDPGRMRQQSRSTRIK